jgi:carboxyl-terminal processing protease
VETLRDGYGLKFTIARYYTPSGRSIQAKGVEPDLEVKYLTLSDTESSSERMFMEKDLKNHLNAESDEAFEEPRSEPPAPKQEVVPDPPALQRFKSKNSPLDRETLLSDNQVLRALDILISFDIFKDLKNG